MAMLSSYSHGKGVAGITTGRTHHNRDCGLPATNYLCSKTLIVIDTRYKQKQNTTIFSTSHAYQR